MVFYSHIYKADKTEQSELWLNGITIEEKPENLTILLNEKGVTKETTANLPTNSEIFSAITKTFAKSSSDSFRWFARDDETGKGSAVNS